jgi:hypothetical protein
MLTRKQLHLGEQPRSHEPGSPPFRPKGTTANGRFGWLIPPSAGPSPLSNPLSPLPINPFIPARINVDDEHRRFLAVAKHAHVTMIESDDRHFPPRHANQVIAGIGGVEVTDVIEGKGACRNDD